MFFLFESQSPNECFANSTIAFKAGNTTQNCLAKLLEKQKHLLENGYDIGVLFMDLSKPFDVLNRFLLHANLDVYGFSLKSMTFIQSFLNKRMQKVNVNNKFSSWEDIYRVGHRVQYLAHSSSFMTFSASRILAICVTTLMITLYILRAEISTKFKNIRKKILKYQKTGSMTIIWSFILKYL